MNSEFNEWLHSSPTAMAPATHQSGSARGLWYWVRRLLVCNPFFLGSAALLLLGVHQLSLDPGFLSDEGAKLLFNFGALQFYELLVVVTAVILARRKIWYDSALLVVVEHGLILVPFMLISQGALMNPKLGWLIAFGAAVIAALRALFIHRKYTSFNLPPRALYLGGVILLLNAALPAVFRWRIDDGQEQWAQPNLWLWYVALPLLVSGANLLARPTRYGGLNPERHWLPLFIYGLWVAGTGAHFWCLGYVSEQPFANHYLAPAAVVAAWTLWRRIPDCVPQPGARWQTAMLCLTFAAPLVAFGDPLLFEGLVLINALAYAVLFQRRAGIQKSVLRELVLASLAMLVLGVPKEFAQGILPNFTRIHAVLLALATGVLIAALRSPRMGIGFAGALSCGSAVALLWPSAAPHAVVESAALFLLAHSLGWTRNDAAASFLRTVTGMIWMADAMVWVHAAPWQLGAGISSAALALALAWWMVSRLSGQRRDWIVLASALGVFLITPGDWLLRKGSPGLAALAASFATFAVGVGVAWTRHVWDRINGLHR